MSTLKHRRLFLLLMTFILVVGSVAIPVSAANTENDNTTILRISNRINQKISANSIIAIEDWFYLDVGDTVVFNCTYTPKNSNLDFGVVNSDGVFYSVNCSNGNINKSISIEIRDQYTLAIRNNESYAVTVTGTVKY